MALSFEHYRTFYYVGKCRNLSLAAKLLYGSQPNISRTVALLEREYRCRLVERTNRGVRLTPEGEKLYTLVAPAVEQLMLAEESVGDIAKLRYGTVSIGVSDTGLSELVLPALNRYREEYPQIQVKIAASYSLESVKAVKNSLCDFAVVAGPLPADETLIYTPVMDFSDIMICGKSYSFLIDKAVGLEDVCRYPLVCVGKNTVLYSFLNDVFAGDGIDFAPDIISTTTAQTILMVKNDLGIGFVPEVCAREELERKSVLQLACTSPLPKRSIYLVERKRSTLSVAAKEFKKTILLMK